MWAAYCRWACAREQQAGAQTADRVGRRSARSSDTNINFASPSRPSSVFRPTRPNVMAQWCSARGSSNHSGGSPGATNSLIVVWRRAACRLWRPRPETASDRNNNNRLHSSGQSAPARWPNSEVVQEARLAKCGLPEADIFWDSPTRSSSALRPHLFACVVTTVAEAR